jgi:hypothetical protein
LIGQWLQSSWEELSLYLTAPDLGDEDADLIPLEEMEDVILCPEILDEEEEPEPQLEKKGAKGKRRRGEERQERKERRKKWMEMSTFGSYEDYAKLIEEAEHEGED